VFISRIQVEEGFLDGLDLTFDEGLNVLIGSRGAGKTSIIELIRFCLGTPALTERVAETSREHALSILGSGRVTVTVVDGKRSISISRTGEQVTRSETIERTPVILSQNEIEAVGLHSTGRLRLIDSIRPKNSRDSKNDEAPLLAYIRSQTQERRSLFSELQTIRTQLRELGEQLKESDALKKQHADALSSIEKAQAQTQRLNILSGWLTALSVRGGVYNRILAALQQWQSRLNAVSEVPISIEAWPAAAGADDPLGSVRQIVEDSRRNILEAVTRVADAIAELGRLSAVNDQQTLQYQEEARGIRRQLETLQKGAGEIAKKLAALQEKAGQQSALRDVEKAKTARLREIQDARKQYLDKLEAVRVARFEARAAVISELNAKFGPRIHVSIERAGMNSEYASAIVAALRGSGLHFNEAAPVIADQISPREFVELVENEDAEEFANITGLPLNRAARIISRVDEQGVEDILTASIEDGVTLSLLDGTEYKTTEQLSTGQRCTVVLPILLQQQGITLIIDQPEDHLDNAFIVETLIRAIIDRKDHGQLIFSTHNANIPVLGEANRVSLLGSDGSRGFVLHSGSLHSPESVRAITTVMEGGLEAFDRRSQFYHRKT
jgi:DNA repair ATPase RecN